MNQLHSSLTKRQLPHYPHSLLTMKVTSYHSFQRRSEAASVVRRRPPPRPRAPNSGRAHRRGGSGAAAAVCYETA